jgi:small subunit ribosomal protein S16
MGRRNRPYWRLCATDKRTARDGRVIEELGHYDPHRANEDKVAIKRDRVIHWLQVGATPSKTVKELLGHLGIGPKGNEITPKPWPKKKQGPPPKAAERLAAQKAEADKAQAAEAQAETAEAAPEAAPESAPAEAATDTDAGAEAGTPEAPPADDAEPPDAPA